MKLFNYLSIIAVGLIITSACSTTTKNDNEGEAQESCIYTIDDQSLNFQWTAYKFTNKTGVKGTFDDIIVTSDDDAASLNELLNSIGFAINTGSVNSNEVTRDLKIAQFFFGTMENTSVINGELNDANDKGVTIALKLNDMTVDVPATIEVSGDTVTLKSTVDFKAFDAAEALAMLNQVCSEKHTGEDGKSVFWDVVDIKVQALYKQECK